MENPFRVYRNIECHNARVFLKTKSRKQIYLSDIYRIQRGKGALKVESRRCLLAVLTGFMFSFRFTTAYTNSVT